MFRIKRPHELNALTDQGWRELRRVFSEAEAIESMKRPDLAEGTRAFAEPPPPSRFPPLTFEG